MEMIMTIFLPLFAGFLVGIAINLPSYIESRRQLRQTKKEIAEQQQRILNLIESARPIQRK